MSGDGRLFALERSPARGAAEALAWLWRLGPLLDAPDARAVGFGGPSDEAELTGLLKAGSLAGLVLFAPDEGPATAAVPERRRRAGVASFGPGQRLAGEFTLFGAGAAGEARRSSLGVHAVRDGNTLMLAADPAAAWTLLHDFWCAPVLAGFLAEVLERPLVILPPVGVVRLDDIPGTAQHQVEGRDKSDARQRRRVLSLRRAYRASGATLNVAVPARALADGEEVPLERVWPRAVAAIAEGVAEGSLEPVCHGYLHLDRQKLDQGEVEFREFGSLDEMEAGRRLDVALDWQASVLGRRPDTFVAPAWAYSDGALAASASRDLPAWLRPRLGPPLEGPNVHESFNSALRGLHRLDYGPFAALAAAGIPPTPVLHGGLFDLRASQLKADRDVVTLARLALRRDAVRLPGVPGVRWIRAGELVRVLRAHDRIEVRGAEVELNDTDHALVVGAAGPGGVAAHA